MTTSAMVFAMLPLALKMGEGAETRSPMAVVVIGGLLTSTLLTLVVVPAGYTVMDDLQQWLGRRFHRKSAPPAAPATPSGTGETLAGGPDTVPEVFLRD